MGVMCIAIEATTLASHSCGDSQQRHALKRLEYIIICSVGIAVALLGIILLHFSSWACCKAGKSLDWTALFDNAKS
jgi:hydrogenase-4 component F